MFRRSWFVQRLAEAGLLGGLWLTSSSAVLAQQALPGLGADAQVITLEEATASQPPGKAEPIPAPKEPGAPVEAAAPAEKKPPEPKPFWATHPQYTPYPRTGNFPIPPSGPGYYSLRDVCEGNFRENPPKFPFPPVSLDFFPFFDANYNYIDDPKNTQLDWLDCLKRIHPNDCWLLSFGGEFRARYDNEVDSRLTGRNNVYELYRTRLYGDLWYRDNFRIYIEYIDAFTANQDLAPLAIDINRSDLLNAFADVKVWEYKEKPVYVRVGRQELCYGSQRLISPLDWANTRRTFEGVKGFWHGEKLDLDAFWTRPVQVFPGRYDAGDVNRQFAGLWTTYRPKKGQAIDMYYLYFDQPFQLQARLPVNGRGGQNVNTVGARYAGDYDQALLWDFEGMWQFGEIINNSISAGAATAGLGYHCKDVCLNPTFWAYIDHADGDQSGGRGGTFNQLFPFGHFYFGFIDVVGRQNINDFNLHAIVYPAKWIQALAQVHFFYLDSGRDALYNAGGAAIRRSPRGNAGVHVGNEIDFLVNFHLSPHQDVLLSYSTLYAGEFIRKTGSALSPDYFYLQYSFKW